METQIAQTDVKNIIQNNPNVVIDFIQNGVDLAKLYYQP